MKKLCKSKKNKMLFGVCGGLAEYFNIDPTVIRIIFALLAVFSGAGIILYIIAAIIMPQSDRYADDEDIDNLKSANMDSDDTKYRESKNNRGGDKNEAAHTDAEFDSYFKK